MIDSGEFFRILSRLGVEFFTGVPDSLLKDFCAFISDNVQSRQHVISANEGAAVALAAGHHLATDGVPLVYLQNSGMGNATNPLLSLADYEVYQIPMLLLIGWRGEPGVKDEPQHVKQGRISKALLDTMEIPCEVLPADIENAGKVAEQLLHRSRDTRMPCAILVRKGTFCTYESKPLKSSGEWMTREEAIMCICQVTDPQDAVVATTGKASRELFELRQSAGSNTTQDFLTVGSMGHASQIAVGIALAQSQRQVFCLDGDGAFIMHMGSVAVNGQVAPENFKHIVLNNGVHDSVGGQPTAGFSADICKIASACGYRWSKCVATPEDVKCGLEALRNQCGPCLLEIRTRRGARSDLGRPTSTPVENKTLFMKFLKQ